MRKNTLPYHILFWSILYVLWIIFFQNHSFTIVRTMTVQFCYLIFITADFYVVNYFFSSRILKKSWPLFIAVSVLAIALSSLLRALLASFMNLHFFLPGQPQLLFSDLLLSSFVNIFIWVLIVSAGKMLIDRFQGQRYLALVEKEKAMNELNFLKAQVNPHFLFNSLNSIYGYIDKKNQTARSILLQFSEMLRYQLYDCNADRVSLSKEIAYLRNYIALQQYRKEESLVVDFQSDASLNDCEIIPLLLVVFVENAFKYVSNFDEKENRISISLARNNGQLNFVAFNTTEQRINNTNGGIGLSNARRRLEILYPGRHELEIQRGNETFEIRLKIYL